MYRCPHCRDRTISAGRKLFLAGQAFCPQCRGKFTMSPLGWLVWAAALALDVGIVFAAREPAYLLSVIVPLLLALGIYLALPLAPKGEGFSFSWSCPHCNAKTVTWKQKLSLRQNRTALCSACEKQFGLSSLNWINLAMFLIAILALIHYVKGPAQYGVLAGVLVAHYLVRLFIIPVVKK